MCYNNKSMCKRRVSFDEKTMVVVSEVDELLSPEERHALWYGPAEIVEMRTQVRALCRQLRQQQHSLEEETPPARELQRSSSASQLDDVHVVAAPPQQQPPPTEQQQSTEQHPQYQPLSEQHPQQQLQERKETNATRKRAEYVKLYQQNAEDDSFRGLEHRVCLRRQRHKAMALRYIVKAQKHCSDTDQLARFAQKCTAWAYRLALEEAQMDASDDDRKQ